MEPALSIQLVFALASREATAAAYKEIEIPHTFSAILKFAELDEGQLKQMLKEPSAASVIIADHGKVVTMLKQHAITIPDKSTAIRHQLRVEVGKGGSPYDPQRVMHRSAGLKKLCKSSEDIAKTAHENEWKPVHLLEVLFNNPSPEMDKVLKNTGISAKKEEAKKTPLLDKYGIDMTGMAASGNIGLDVNISTIERDVVYKVVSDELFGGNKKNVLIVQTGGRAADEIANWIAAFIANGSVPPDARTKKIIEIPASFMKMADGLKGELEAVDIAFEDRTESLFEETAQNPDIILHMQDFENFIAGESMSGNYQLIKEKLLDGKAHCLATIGIDNYNRYMRQDAGWKKIFHIVYLYDVSIYNNDFRSKWRLWETGEDIEMFTDKAQEIINLARDYAFTHRKQNLDMESVVVAAVSDIEAGIRLAECLTNGNVTALRAKCPQLGQPAPGQEKIDVADTVHKMLGVATELAYIDGIPDRTNPGLIDIGHLVCAITLSRDACQLFDRIKPISRDDAISILTKWYSDEGGSSSISELVGDLRLLRSELLSRVFGQDHAIHAFIEGLYNAQITAAADISRKRPAAIFVFAGPPGCGKTYLAELTSSLLKRPFKRFDMTGYTDHQQHNQLVGFAPSYQAAQSGLLTGFVEQNPNAFLLFDEIEKAHGNTIQLFYQILDAGRLEDKYLGKDIDFKDTIIIFTTNAGRSLYDNPNRIGISTANSSYHKRTILSALENEKNPTTGQPAFPQAICSRLAQGYPLMFNHLGVNELYRVSNTELERNERLFASQYFKEFSHDPVLPLCLVLREGGNVDARQLRTETEKFIKSEIFNYCNLYDQPSIEKAFADVDKVRFQFEGGADNVEPEVKALFESPNKPKILLIANAKFTGLCERYVSEMDWLTASSVEEAISILSTEDVDMILLDIWIRRDLDRLVEREKVEEKSKPIPSGDISKTLKQDFDFIPLSAHALDEGRNILEKIHERAPEIPIYLLSFTAGGDTQSKKEGDNNAIAFTVSFDAAQGLRDESAVGEPQRRAIDDELFLACVRAGGARGLVSTDFVSTSPTGWETRRQRFTEALSDINHRLYREKTARSLVSEHKVIRFDTVAITDKKNRQLSIQLRNFHLSRAVEASDAGEMVDDVRRPSTRLEDVIGAKAAKEALQFVIDWLSNPKRYATLGVRPPKGILLGGPPGTGKTMLARAVAGESRCAFVETSATNFVTIWQGSGPQNVRNLFDRARRYAPAIVFIDEIDAIGRKRMSGISSGRAEEETLNALLTEMDGFSASTQRPVIVLAATNFEEALDEALKRRFDRFIEVDRPDKAARLKYLEKVVLRRKNSQVTQKVIERIAGQSAGMTIADIERIVHEASVVAAQQASGMTDEILEAAFEKIRMGEATTTPDPETLKRIARHEAGHALIDWFAGNAPVQITIIGRGHAGGYVEKEAEEERIIYTKIELLDNIRASMGGRAAEIIYYGTEGGLSTGVSSDLQKATRLAQRMVREFGMAEDFGQLALDSQQIHDGPLAIKVNEAAERIVSEQLKAAVESLTKNRQYLDALSEKLLENNRLTRQELEEILPPLGKKE